MTASPIPRTLALTVHGDLDLTVIDGVPKGRLPIKTSETGSHREVYELIKREVNSGRQVYIVYPLIDESESLAAKAATIEAEKLKSGVFTNLNIGLLHGKLKNADKEQVMKDFKEKKYDILVSTTVVEVGVDVPNATVMVIENAERFGLSQLHQLRGRVGRGAQQSYCILMASYKISSDAKQRLQTMCKTTDGFLLAEEDLRLRGPGSIAGTAQSGVLDLKLADIVRDEPLMKATRSLAIEIIEQDSNLSQEKNALLRDYFIKNRPLTDFSKIS